MKCIQTISLLCSLLVITACAGPSREELLTQAKERQAEREQLQREYDDALAKLYPGYPMTGTTYLSYDAFHGYQVIYYEDQTRSWLWYPGNAIALPADVKVDDQQICWRYGQGTRNRVTREVGGTFSCQSKKLSLRTRVGALDGDVFDLASGRIPYVRRKCDAPDEFQINGDFAMFEPADDCATNPA